jgi:hypothetical protein
MLVFIGTLHCGLTPEDELIELIGSFHPSRLLIEITQQDLESSNTMKYPPEMQAALAWAKSKHIEVHGIDSSIKTLKEGILDKDLKKLDDEQTAITSKHGWKVFNNPEFFKVLETKTWQKIVDTAKDEERNIEMYQNICHFVNESDPEVTVIVTGSGHIPFFRDKFPTAQFPLS